MSEPHDLRLHAETLRRHLRYSQTRRFKRHVAVMLSSIALGLTGAGWPLTAVILVDCVYTATAVSWHGVLLAEVARLAPRDRISNTTGGVLAFGSAGMALFPLGFGAILGVSGIYLIGFFLAAVPAAIATGLLLVMPRAP